MSETDQPSNGMTATPDQNHPNAQVLGQFIKDLSFENPKIERMLDGGMEKPSLTVEVNVAARRIEDDIYESSIEFTAKAQIKDGMLYELEVIYSGLFKLENLPPEAVETVLLVNSPMLLFPFLRRVVADTTREGGFPPLFLDPIDFNKLYVTRKKEGGVVQQPNA